MIDISTKTKDYTIPWVFPLSRWDPKDKAAYITLTTAHPKSEDAVKFLAKEAMQKLEEQNGTKNELHYYIRIESKPREYIRDGVFDPNQIRPHAHIVVGKHKLIASQRNPTRDYEWLAKVMNQKEIWPYGIVKCERFDQYRNGPKPNGALVYNLKSEGKHDPHSWDAPVYISDRLNRHLLNLAKTSDTGTCCLPAIYSI